MGKKDESFVSKHDIYEKLWAARDFEISHLWQRSLFLATFITLTFTLYFSALNSLVLENSDSVHFDEKNEITKVVSKEEMEYSSDDNAYTIIENTLLDNDYAKLITLNIICLFGYSFAVLWICMARGSKYMYERIENGINIANEGRKNFFDDDMENELVEEFYETLWADGDYEYIPRHGSQPLSEYNFRVYSGHGGYFSSSKVNILIGYILLLAWIILSVGNAFMVYPVLSADSKPTDDCIFVVSTCLYFAVFTAFLCNRQIVCFALFVVSVMYTYIQMSLDHNCFALWIEIQLVLQLGLFFVISRLCLSGYSLTLGDILLLTLNDGISKKEGDKNQFRFLLDFFRNNESQYESIQKHVMDKFRELSNNDNQYNNLIDDFLSFGDAGSIRRLYSNEYLKYILETSMMHREKFPESFRKKWCDVNDDDVMTIEEERILFSGSIQIIVNSSEIDITKDKTDVMKTETRLYADNRWADVRINPKSWQPGVDDKKLHVIQKQMNADTIYLTIEMQDKSKVKVNLTVVNKLSALSNEKKFSSYAFELLAKE